MLEKLQKAGWKTESSRLIKTFSFTDFKEALAFVNKIGNLAEEANHHPDISLSWGEVVVGLSTHDAGGVTQKDIGLAKKIEKLYKRRN